MSRSRNIFISLACIFIFLFITDISTGPVSLSLSEIWGGLIGKGDAVTIKIVRDIRLTKAIVAIITGIALSVSGLMMQTLFRNPLAGPYVLGLSSGASLGVALFILGMPFLGIASNGVISSLGTAGAAWLGAAAVLFLLSATARRIKDIMVILILGMCFSSGIGAIVEILQYLSDEQSLKAFVVWTMGSLGDVSKSQLPIVAGAVSLGLILAVSAVKSLNLLLMGEGYARTMGQNTERSRQVILASTTLLAGTVTAFCGPVGFVGVVVPHIARRCFRTANHNILLPASSLCGAIMVLFCDIVSKLFALPVNSVTSLLGIPIVIWIVIKHKTI